MDAIDVLMEARAYIGKGWCQGWLARDVRGWMCNVDAPEAQAWCVGGSVVRVMQSDQASDTQDAAFVLLARVLGIDLCGIVSWNDDPSRTQSEVLEAFDRAIALGLDEERAAIRSGS